MEGIDKSKCAMIITTKPDLVTKALSENFESSGTVVNAKGGYSKNEKAIIYFIINHFQINKLKRIILDIDEKSFISISEVSEIVKDN